MVPLIKFVFILVGGIQVFNGNLFSCVLLDMSVTCCIGELLYCPDAGFNEVGVLFGYSYFLGIDLGVLVALSFCNLGGNSLDGCNYFADMLAVDTHCNFLLERRLLVVVADTFAVVGSKDPFVPEGRKQVGKKQICCCFIQLTSLVPHIGASAIFVVPESVQPSIGNYFHSL
jgi:hypothetical protein